MEISLFVSKRCLGKICSVTVRQSIIIKHQFKKKSKIHHLWCKLTKCSFRKLLESYTLLICYTWFLEPSFFFHIFHDYKIIHSLCTTFGGGLGNNVDNIDISEETSRLGNNNVDMLNFPHFLGTLIWTTTFNTCIIVEFTLAGSSSQNFPIHLVLSLVFGFFPEKKFAILLRILLLIPF